MNRSICFVLALAGWIAAGPVLAAGASDPVTGRPLQVAARTPAADDPQASDRAVVDYGGQQRPGTVVVNTKERYLYLVLQDGKAIRYGIGVARRGFEWRGSHPITMKRNWPAWRPPAQMRRRQPYLPAYMEGGPDNPLGARALYLGATLYRIHGTNEAASIGHAVSSGCIRMHNADVIDLYERVKVGTRVDII